jgi:hypothetical protein
MIYKLIYEVLTLVKGTIHLLQRTTTVLRRNRPNKAQTESEGRD